MMMIRRAATVFFFFLVILTKLSSQEFLYKAGYFGFFDNREYFNTFTSDQTIFGSRISGELGYAFNDNNRIMAGLDYLYEFGSRGEWIAPDFTAYYEGHREKLDFYMGAVPRFNKIGMPLSILNDTFQYYRPNLEGIFINFGSGEIHHNVWIDWTGRQSFEKQESFLIGFSGYLKRAWFIYQHHFLMSHLAHSLNSNLEEHIRDNAGFTILPGADLTGLIKLDSLTLSAGLLCSYDRWRGIYDFNFPLGFYSEMKANHKNFGLQATLYIGESQIITSGDGFYKSDFYCRTDAYYQVIKSGIEGKLQFSFHFLPDVVDLSMALVIRAQLDGIFGDHQSRSLK